MWLLYQACRFLGKDPFRLYNNLDESNRPIGQPDADPVFPKYPERLRTFIYGLGAFAADEEIMKVKAIAGVGAKRAMGA